MQIIQDRRALHQIPERQMYLPKTAQYVQEQLQQLRCRVFRPVEYGLCAFFDNGAQETIAFRADMDALAVTEKTGLPYASRHAGSMHACGHDGHTAILLELARRMDQCRLERNVLLIFQPGEESPGGAKPICDTGVLREYGVKTIFGLHLWPGLEKGSIYSRVGGLMSRSSELTVTFAGKSAHIGKAELARDAMAACVEFYTKAVAMEQAMPADIYRLLKFGKLESGTVRNVIAACARLEGSLRTFDDGVFDQMAANLRQIGSQVAESTGCAVEVHLAEGYPAISNPRWLYEAVDQLIPLRQLPAPSMTSEDFSWYQKYVPGMFFFLGVGDTPALHAAEFDFDESVLQVGADFMERLAREFPLPRELGK